MLLTSTDREEADREAIREDKIKRELEENMERDLKVLFKRITKDFEKAMRAVGLIPDQSVYFDRLKEIIAKHQKRTAEIFSQSIRNDLEKGLSLFETKVTEIEISEDEEQDLAGVIGSSIALFIDEQSTDQADLILDTNQRELSNEVFKANNDIAESGESPELRSVAAVAGLAFAAKAIARSKSIAVLNVGMVESESKQVEAEVLNQSSAKTVGGVIIAGRITKNWNAVNDSRTRPAHTEADLTYFSNPISVFDKFIVMGEQMRFPRDPNGSAGNIINCRCTSQHSII